MQALRIASYNIHRCVGSDGCYQPARIRDVLHELDAQVIALQEVESGRHHGELLEYLTTDSDWRCIEGITLERETGRYGNAILTALPVLNCQQLDLSYKEREPRGAIDLHVQHQAQRIRVIATHLGLLPDERRTQIRTLLDWIGAPQDDIADVTLLLGDLNEWFLWGRPLRWLRAWFGATPAPATYPTRWPLFALDRIWANPRAPLRKVETHRSALARLASDHYPVTATLHW